MDNWPGSRITSHYRCRDSLGRRLLRMGSSSVSKQRPCFQARGLHESCNIVRLAQEKLRGKRVAVVSLSFLNLSCVNVFFEVKLHGAVGPRGLASWWNGRVASEGFLCGCFSLKMTARRLKA